MTTPAGVASGDTPSTAPPAAHTMPLATSSADSARTATTTAAAEAAPPIRSTAPARSFVVATTPPPFIIILGRGGLPLTKSKPCCMAGIVCATVDQSAEPSSISTTDAPLPAAAVAAACRRAARGDARIIVDGAPAAAPANSSSSVKRSVLRARRISKVE